METESKLLLSHGEIEKWKMQTQGYKTNMSETEATRQNMLDELLAKLKDTTLAVIHYSQSFIGFQLLLLLFCSCKKWRWNIAMVSRCSNPPRRGMRMN